MCYRNLLGDINEKYGEGNVKIFIEVLDFMCFGHVE